MAEKLMRKTRRLVIRPFERGDYVAWKAAHVSSLPAKNFWDLGPSKPEERTRAEFNKKVVRDARLRRKDVFYDLAVFEHGGAFVGMVSLMEVARGISHTAFLGYRIFNTHWGKGYAKEAIRAGIDIAFRDVKLHRIEAGIEPENKRSLALARSLGMRREGVKKRALYLREKWVDLIMYTLTTEDVGHKFDTRVFRGWKPRH